MCNPAGQKQARQALPPLHLDAQLREVLPSEDRVLSPYTGITRDHWIAVADHLLLSAAHYRSPGGARINFPGRPSQQGVRTDGIEGFARTFLLAAFVHAGSGGHDPHDHLSRYLDGVVRGTRSIGADDEESWPVVGHIGRDAQPHVEAASIALSLHLTRSDSWDCLSPDEQDRVADWFKNTIRMEPSANNWYLFPTTIASFLEGVGRGDDETSYVIERGLGLIEKWYRGDGWYSDGAGEAFDHYVGWAMHLYPLLHARLRQDHDLENRLGGRLKEFLESFGRTFDRNGAPLYYGRSMTYRTATLASVALGEVVDQTPLSHGQSRRVLSAGLRYFVERGSINPNGVLSLGWHGEHLPSIQRYSGPGSPYWASKGFLGLMLPAEHPLWTEREEKISADTTDSVLPIAPAGLLVQNTRLDGMVRLHNHGNDHLKRDHADAGAPDPLYARFAYSTRTGPTALHNPSDNDFQLRVRGVGSVRRKIHVVGSGPDWVASWHAPRFPVYGPWEASPTADGGPVLPSARIESLVLAHGALEVRVHRVVGAPPKLPVRLSGWAVAGHHPREFDQEVGKQSVTVQVAADPESLSSSLRSTLVGLEGFSSADVQAAPYGTAFGEWALVPELGGIVRSGQVYAALVSLDAGEGIAGPVKHVLDGAVLTVSWPDGADSTVDLDAIFSGLG